MKNSLKNIYGFLSGVFWVLAGIILVPLLLIVAAFAKTFGLSDEDEKKYLNYK